MKQKLIASLTLIFFSLDWCSSCNAQDCQISIGSVVEAMNSIQQVKRKVVALEKYKTFKFRGFEPADPITTGNKVDDFYGVGFDEKHEIIEINYYSPNDSNQYKMLVYDFPAFKLMVVQLNGGEGEGFKYNFSVIVVSKQPSRFFIYNVNLFPTDEGVLGLINTPVFLKYGIDKISVIMILSENLRPWQLVSISRTQILRTSHVFYKSTNRVSYESVQVHYNTADKPALKINHDSCLATICENSWRLNGEIFNLNLTIDRADRLWHFGGMHDFRYENSRIVSKLPE